MTMTATEPLALHGGTPARSRPWPAWPVWDESDAAALLGVLESGKWFSGSGTRNAEFADHFCRAHRSRYAVPVANGTQALEIALRAAGVQAGDEVITTPYTFIATASAIVQVNAVPVFADVEPGTLNLDARSTEAAVTPKTRAIMAVHIAGNPADMDALQDVARRHNLLLLEDAAQAHLAEWKGRPVGAIGEAGTFSFQASKNLNCGDGGVGVSDHEEIFENAWSLTNCGRVRNGGWYEHRMLSGNFRLTEFQAALLLSQMARLPEQAEHRTRNALYLAQQLAEIEGIRPLTRDPRVSRHAYHKFILRYRQPEFGPLSRDEFIQVLRAEGVPCIPGYSPTYRSPAFKIDTATHPYAGAIDYAALRLPEVEQACDEAVWFDQSLLLAEQADMDDITAAIRKIQRAVRG